MDESVNVGQPDTGHGDDQLRDGAACWLPIHDDLLRGLTHALSNRLGTIAATAYLLEAQPDAVATSTATLRAESDRLDQLLLLLRLLPRRAGASAEPMIPTDACSQAVALLAHHPTVGEVPLQVELDGDVQPVYMDPTALVLALTAAGSAAQAVAGRAGRARITIGSDTERVVFSARAVDAAPGSDERSDERSDEARDVLRATCGDAARAAAWLLRHHGGAGEATDDGVIVSVPTLQAARRMQRRA